MNFLNSDDVLAGLKRGADKFGSAAAIKVVKQMAKRLNGLAPDTQEPYGAGLGEANTEQESRDNDIPTAKLRQQNKLEFLKKELELSADAQEKAVLALEIKSIQDELSGSDEIRSNAGDAGSASGASAASGAAASGAVDSSSLGYQSAQKTATAERELYDSGMKSKCLACGFESQNEWKGRCESCLVKNEKSVSDWLTSKDDVIKENHSDGDDKEPWATEDVENSGNCEKCAVAAGGDDNLDSLPSSKVFTLDHRVHLAKDQNNGLMTAPCGATLHNEKKNSSDPKSVWDKADIRERAAFLVASGACDKEDAPYVQAHSWEAIGSGTRLLLTHHFKLAGLLNSTDKDEKEVQNAGHLSPEAWMAAATEERAVWLELAGMDINLATTNWADLSADVHKALSNIYDKPACVNNEKEESSTDAEVENAEGKPAKKHFFFKDLNGEEESVQAENLDKAWEMLANIFGTPVDEIRRMGVKFVRENSDPEGDLAEIESHVEGIEHELGELKENAEDPECICGKYAREHKEECPAGAAAKKKAEDFMKNENEISPKGIANSGVKRGFDKYGTKTGC